MKRSLSIILSILLLLAISSCLIGCDKDTSDGGIDYSLNNNFEVSCTEDNTSIVYSPTTGTPEYGLIFYVGTAIEYVHYKYLGEALAKQGYLVVIPKVTAGLAYLLYNENEVAFTKYPNVKFFVGGHSQGGGAAVRRAQENVDKVQGVILYAPLCYGSDSIRTLGLPTLLLEATKDGVLTADMKSDAKTRLPDNRTEYMIEGCHMSFSSLDDDGTLSFFKDGPATAEVKAEQKSKTVNFTMAFMKEVVTK